MKIMFINWTSKILLETSAETACKAEHGKIEEPQIACQTHMARDILVEHRL